MCGATTTWLFTLVLDEANWDLAGPAMAGAIGDKQAVGGFLGVNAAIAGPARDRKSTRLNSSHGYISYAVFCLKKKKKKNKDEEIEKQQRNKDKTDKQSLYSNTIERVEAMM